MYTVYVLLSLLTGRVTGCLIYQLINEKIRMFSITTSFFRIEISTMRQRIVEPSNRLCKLKFRTFNVRPQPEKNC